MKKIVLVMLALVFAFALCSCGNSSSNVVEWDNSPSYANKSSFEVVDKNTTAVDTDYASKEADEYSQKLIKTQTLVLETLDFDAGTDKIAELVSKYDGYFSSSNVSNSGLRNATYTVRVPADTFENFVKEISNSSFNVLSSKLSTEDVTDTYYDLKAQLNSLEQQKERLEALRAKASTLSELITIDDKLTSVHSNMNYVSSRMQYYEKAVDMSFVNITLYETKEYVQMSEPTFGERVGEAISNGWSAFLSFIRLVVIVFLTVLPFLIVCGGIAVAVIIVNKRKKMKKSAKTSTYNSDSDKK